MVQTCLVNGIEMQPSVSLRIQLCLTTSLNSENPNRATHYHTGSDFVLMDIVIQIDKPN